MNRFALKLYTAAFCLAAIPAFYIAQLVRRFGVDVPLWDDWDMVPMIANAHLGQLTFAELFAQQLEARTLLPKLVFILMTFTGRYDARDAMLLSVVLCCFTAIGLFVLLRKSGLSPLAVTICFLLMVIGIFSPAQEELWLLASGFPSFMPVLFILTGLLVLRSGWSVPVKFAICAALAVASTFTLAHGLLAFGLTFPVFLLWDRVPRWPLWLAGWCAVGAGCAVAYFWGYYKPPEVPDFAPPVPLFAYVHYVLAFLGGAVAYGVRPFSNEVPLAAATWAGAMLLVLFAAAAAYVFAQRGDRQFLRRALPWVALGCYSIGCAIPASLGRIGLGVQQALDSRYVTFSLYLTVALIALVPMILGRLRVRVVLPAISTSLAAVYVALYAAGFGTSVDLLEERAARYRLGRAAVVFSHAIDTRPVFHRNNSTIPDTARVLAGTLDKLGLLQPPLIRTNRVDKLPHEIADGEEAAGQIDRSAPMEGGLVSVSGWAALEEKSRPPDCVVLAYQTHAQEWVLLAMSDKIVPRPDVAERLDDEDQLWSGWTAKFAPSAVPPGAKIAAWAFDADESKLYKLAGEVTPAAR
jgi:hypothetical protein